jgi:hypothetical protein
MEDEDRFLIAIIERWGIPGMLCVGCIFWLTALVCVLSGIILLLLRR